MVDGSISHLIRKPQIYFWYHGPLSASEPLAMVRDDLWTIHIQKNYLYQLKATYPVG